MCVCVCVCEKVSIITVEGYNAFYIVVSKAEGAEGYRTEVGGHSLSCPTLQSKILRKKNGGGGGAGDRGRW